MEVSALFSNSRLFFCAPSNANLPFVQEYEQPVFEAVDGLLPVELVSEVPGQRHLLVRRQRGREDVGVVLVEDPPDAKDGRELAVVEAERVDGLMLD